MKQAVWILAALAALATLVLLASESDPETPRLSPDARGASNGETSGAASLHLPTESARLEDEQVDEREGSSTAPAVRVPVSRITGPAAAASAESSSVGEYITLRGTLTMVDPRGSGPDLACAEGSLLVTSIAWPHQPRAAKAAVRDGQWECRVLKAERVRISDVVCGSGAALLLPNFVVSQSVELTDAAFIELRARRIVDTTLRVLDADTRLDLEHVIVATARRQDPGKTYHLHRNVLTDVASPVLLPPEVVARSGDLWVTAPGYAWERLPIDFSPGGERLVLLERGADLEVAVTGLPEDRKLRDTLGLRAGGPTEAYIDAPGEGGNTFRRLKHGDYDIQVEAPTFDGGRQVVGAARARVGPGGDESVVVHLAPFPDTTERQPLRGTLWIPPEWGPVEGVNLHLRPTRQLVGIVGNSSNLTVLPVPCPRGECSWSLAPKPPGTYTLTIGPMNYTVVVETGEAENHIRVPPPADVEVELIEPSGAAAFPTAPLRWRGVSSEGAYSGVERVAPEQGLYRFTAPIGAIRLAVDEPGFAALEQTVTVTPGLNPIALELGAPWGLTVVFQDQGFALPSRFAESIEVRRLDGDGSHEAQLFYDGETFRGVPEPGLYEVSAVAPAGYHQPAPVRVDVPGDRVVEVIVDVARDG